MRLLAIAGMLIVLALYSLYPSYIIWDMSKTAGLPVISSFSLVQTYTMYLIVRMMVVVMPSKKTESNSLDETLDNMVPGLLINTIGITLVWGIFHIMIRIWS